jgi:hypothetical protein
MLNSSINDEIYKQKYLKYKFKYLELKEIVGGKLTKEERIQDLKEKYDDSYHKFIKYISDEFDYFNKLFGKEFNLNAKVEEILDAYNQYLNKQKGAGNAYSRRCNELDDSDTKTRWIAEKTYDLRHLLKRKFSLLTLTQRNFHEPQISFEDEEQNFNLFSPEEIEEKKITCNIKNNFYVFADNIKDTKEQVELRHRLEILVKNRNIFRGSGFGDFRYLIHKESPKLYTLEIKT